MLQKTTESLVEKFLKKEEKISKRVTLLDEQIAEKKSAIQEEKKNLVTLEIDEETGEMDVEERDPKQVRKNIKKLETEIDELNDMREAYADVLSSIDISDKEKQKIKEAALKEQDERSQQLDEKTEELSQIDAQIKELEVRKKQVESERNFLSSDQNKTERHAIKRILKYIEPRHESIKPSHKGNYIECWLHDGDLEQHFEIPYEEQKGFQITERATSPSNQAEKQPDVGMHKQQA